MSEAGWSAAPEGGQDGEEAAFRARVRAFIAEQAPAMRVRRGHRAPDEDDLAALRQWTAALYREGFYGADWPAKWGGTPGANPFRQAIVVEELARANAPTPIGAGYLASRAVLAHGTEEQKRRFLPRIRSGEDLWCQLFSEPDAGSDLASLKTRAVRDGDHFVVSGQKVWTTNGHHADLGYLLARTNPGVAKQAGITAFALDMRTPGVDVRPLREITGTNDFNEVFLDNVRIPAGHVIGEVGGGWRVANASLGHERSGVGARAVELYAQLDDLVELARRSTTADVRPAVADGATRQRIGKLAALTHVTNAMSKAVQSRIANGTEDAADGPLAKIFFSEVNLAMTEAGVGLQGVGGMNVEGDPKAYADGWWQDAYLYARAWTIAGGANEVLKTVVAERALGLPRDKR
jgi:alkylation response protein AidB-like acyl-CoA dehydrogenase